MNILDQCNHARYPTSSLPQYMLCPKTIFFKVFLKMLFIWRITFAMCPESVLIIIELVLIFLNNNNHASKEIEKVFLFFLWRNGIKIFLSSKK